MKHDPFYRQIIGKLQGHLDPDIFEACAADLLREAYPTLVPISGGADAGMDGAIADGEGEPFPLITTTSDKVLGNLTRNLKSYLVEGGSRRKVLLTTSQHLTTRRLRNLYKRANELGFTLINIHYQEDIANRLYRSPEWCQELLNLIGKPSALSTIPQTTRLQISQTLIARDKDLAWLLANDGDQILNDDRILIGQPASGKTFLLQQLVKQENAYFVNSQDLGQIASEIRLKQPKILIVDDAHLKLKLLADLEQIRRETGATFSVVASCWPSQKEKILAIMNLPQTKAHQLELLTRDEIVQVIKAAGIHSPNRLIHEIVNQSEGRPGLGVTLAHLCLTGGVNELISGDAIYRSLLDLFDRLALRQQASTILAAFALGGDQGVSVNVVAEALEMRLIDLLETVSQLDDSGIVFETYEQNLSIRPLALRHVLVRNVFFKGALSLPIQSLLPKLTNIDELASTLIGARARGAVISRELLTDVIMNSYSTKVWEEFAWLGRDEAQWIINNYPEKINELKRPLLNRLPELTIPVLLDKAINDNRPLHAHPDHPLRFITDWIQAVTQKGDGAIWRRKVLLDIVYQWLNQGGDIEVGLAALEAVMSPKFDYNQANPGSGMSSTMYSGLLPLAEILEIKDLWPTVLKILQVNEISNCQSIRHIIREWAYCGSLNIKVPEEVSILMRDEAFQMLTNVISLYPQDLGLVHWALQLAENFNFNLDVSIDTDFITLYPFTERDDWRVEEKKQIVAVKKLAKVWSAQQPTEVAKRLAYIETAAQKMEDGFPRWSPFLCQRISQSVDLGIPWSEAMLNHKVPPDLVSPFLTKAAKQNETSWISLAASCLRDQYYQQMAIALILTLPSTPLELLGPTLRMASSFDQTIQVLCLRNQVPESVLKQLLQHSDPVIRGAAAYGEWFAEPRDTVRDMLYPFWRKVFLTDVNSGHLVKCVLQSIPSLAIDWLENYLGREKLNLHEFDRAIQMAVTSLDTKSREYFLLQVPIHYLETNKLIDYFIANDLSLYQVLLSSEPLQDYHLSPLSRSATTAWERDNPSDFDDQWIAMAKLALDNGYSPEQIANAVRGELWSWRGNESDMWNEWIRKFEYLYICEDERIHQVANIGKSQAEVQKNRAVLREKHEAVYGDF